MQLEAALPCRASISSVHSPFLATLVSGGLITSSLIGGHGLSHILPRSYLWEQFRAQQHEGD